MRVGMKPLREIRCLAIMIDEMAKGKAKEKIERNR
jgi:hypothetical protein